MNTHMFTTKHENFYFQSNDNSYHQMLCTQRVPAIL